MADCSYSSGALRRVECSGDRQVFACGIPDGAGPITYRCLPLFCSSCLFSMSHVHEGSGAGHQCSGPAHPSGSGRDLVTAKGTIAGLTLKVSQLRGCVDRHQQALSHQRRCFADARAEVAALNRTQEECQPLDVGGRHFTASRAALLRRGAHLLSVLAAGDFGCEADADGRVFVDRDPRWFAAVLAYLRAERPALPLGPAHRRELLREARYYGLQELCRALCRPPIVMVTPVDRAELPSTGCCVHAADQAGGAWERIGGAVLRGRSEFGSCVAEGRLYVAGGYDAARRRCPATVHQYDFGAGAWAAAAPLCRPVRQCCMEYVGGRLVLVGVPYDADCGFDATPVVQSLCLRGGRWEEERGAGSPFFTLTSRPMSCVAGGEMYVEGWRRRVVAVVGRRAVQRFPQWEQLPPIPTPRVFATSVAWDGKVVVLGGCRAGQRHCGVVEVYDPATNAWASLPPTGVGGSDTAAVAVDGGIVVVGRGGRVEQYDAGAGRWRALPRHAWLPVRQQYGRAHLLQW